MSGSLWGCSGKSWLCQAVAWAVFALVVAAAADAGADPVAPTAAATVIRLELTSPKLENGGQVAIAIKAMDLATLDASAFGDHEGSSPAR